MQQQAISKTLQECVHMSSNIRDQEKKEEERKNKLTCRPKKRSADKFDSSDPSYCQFLIKL